MSRRALLLTALVVLGAQAGPALGTRPAAGLRGQAQAVRGRVIVVTLDATTFDDWEAPGLPNLGAFLREGALALVGTRTDGDAPSLAAARAEAYASLGAGARARDATALEAGSGPIGALHEVLAASDRVLGVYGSLDAPLPTLLAVGRPRRLALDAPQADPAFPTGVRTDYGALERRLDRDLPRVDVAVIDTGDTARVDTVLGDRPGERARWIVLALARADAFLGWLRPRLEPGDRLVVLSVVAPKSRRDARVFLAPGLAWGVGTPAGMLSSGTTRRAGVVSLLDAAPTILDWLDLPVPAEMEGRAATVAAGPDGLAGVRGLERDLLRSRALRFPFTRWMLGAMMLLVLLALVTVLSGRGRARGGKVPRSWRDLLATLLAAGMALPLGSFLEPLLPIGSVAAAGIAIGAVAAGLALGLRALFGTERALFAILTATAAVLLVDLAAGAPLASRSALGFQIAGGGRFFGVDEGTMGVIVGATLFSVALLLDRAEEPRRLVPLSAMALAAAVFLLGAPSFGSKFGAPFSTVPAFAVLALRAGGRRLDRVAAIGIAIATLFASATFAAADALRSPASQTHVARALGGETAIGPLIARKLGGLVHITFTTIWLPAFGVFVAAVLLLVWRRQSLVARGLWGRPYLRAALAAAAVGSVTALVSNDTGIIAAAPLAMIGAGAFFHQLLVGAGPSDAATAPAASRSAGPIPLAIPASSRGAKER